jgi:hypothetical protein
LRAKTSEESQRLLEHHSKCFHANLGGISTEYWDLERLIQGGDALPKTSPGLWLRAWAQIRVHEKLIETKKQPKNLSLTTVIKGRAGIEEME